MDGFLPIFFLLVVLKIPVLGALWLIWWASRPPEPDHELRDEGGGDPKRWAPGPPRPRGPHSWPRRGRTARRRIRTRPEDVVSERREQVPTDGSGSARPTPSRRAG